MIINSPNAVYVYVALTITFWSTVATVFKLSLQYIDFLSLVFYASLMSLIALGILCLLTHKFKLFRQWQRKDYGRSVLLGVLNPALYYLLLFRAYDRLPAQEAQVLNFSWPIVLILLGVIFLKQKISLASSLAIAVSFFGVVVVATRGALTSLQFSDTQGVVLALLSTILWASYWIINQTDKQDPLLRLFVNFLTGVACLLLVMTFSDNWSTPSFKALSGAVYIGLFEMSLAFFCWFQALKLAPNVSFINNLIFITPFFSLLLISLVLNEAIYPSTVIGLLLICAGILSQRFIAQKGVAP